MSFERPTGLPAEPGATPPPGAESAADGRLTPAMRLQILSTEHWSLLASRSLAWNESFSRAGMFLSTLSGAIVALALVAQASNFGEGFRIFALVILPIVLLVGIGTVLRMGISNYHDAITVVGMNRIRAAYMELAPELKPYFVMGTTDDERGVNLTMAVQPGTSLAVQMLASTPLLVTILDGVLAAAIIALLAIQLGAATSLGLLLGAVAFIVTVGGFAWYAGRDIQRIIDAHQPLFPGPTDPTS
ncbi:MAG: hypothetical protein QOI85_2428 [Chloroflexota bacterium]|jgi:hypothetical protein|nr:hypothetical protein [Chloroflexota bacterium]